jgi:SAM-dependent methyltransferase
MPDEAYWETLFDVPLILSRLGLDRFHDVAELGCGYGTFSIPVAQAITGTLYTLDVDPAMLARTTERGAGLPIVCRERDVMESGFGVQVDAVLLFNILHGERPIELLRHAAHAAPTVLVDWAAQAGLQIVGQVIDLPPWHYGLEFSRATAAQ